MTDAEVRHPYFVQIDWGDDQCIITLSSEFPIQQFRIAVVSPVCDWLIEVEADLGWRYDDGEITWFHGCGETFENAVVGTLQNFLNHVVHTEGLTREVFAQRELIQ